MVPSQTIHVLKSNHSQGSALFGCCYNIPNMRKSICAGIVCEMANNRCGLRIVDKNLYGKYHWQKYDEAGNIPTENMQTENGGHKTGYIKR